MKNFPGVEDAPEKPIQPEAPEAQEASPAREEVPSVEAFLVEASSRVFVPAGVVHRNDVETLLEGPISDEHWEVVAGYVSEYTQMVLMPVIAGLVQNASRVYLAEQAKRQAQAVPQGSPEELLEYFRQVFGEDVQIHVVTGEDEEDE